MQLEKIITLASLKTALELVAMERSLRASGCTLPLYVIPYDDTRFELPPNAYWYENSDFYAWLARFKGRAVNRKYQCLLEKNYQFVDTDIIFLKNPEQALAAHTGFITSCGHWHNPGDTCTDQTRCIIAQQTTTWPKYVFNSGQFACDQAIFQHEDDFKQHIQTQQLQPSVLDYPYHEQAGLNVLVITSGVQIQNLTLPPYHMESTWAGDYLDADYTRYWDTPIKTPYIMHWAGRKPNAEYPIDDLFFQYLTPAEKTDYIQAQHKKAPRFYQQWINRLRLGYKAFRSYSIKK